MDDLQFRRSILADPKSRDDATNEAIKNDVAKQKFAHDVSALDDKIAQAMNIPVPDGLYDNLILRQTMAISSKKEKHVYI